jgi:hypothetical protein
MRTYLICVVIAAVVFGPSIARAAGGCDDHSVNIAVDSACAAASDCCRQITIACVELKYRPLCDWPAHQCVVPLAPCAPELCLERVCHKPVTPCYPAAPNPCLPPVCHKPALVVIPEAPCPVEPTLTGSRELIADCDCAE